MAVLECADFLASILMLRKNTVPQETCVGTKYKKRYQKEKTLGKQQRRTLASEAN